MVMFIVWQAQQALGWGPMRSFWCYGSERFWNFCGHMIKDRAHPLANFINAFNLRRSVDEVPPAWAEEVISYAAQHDEIKHVKSAVEHMQGTPPEPVHGLRALYLRSVKNQKPGDLAILDSFPFRPAASKRRRAYHGGGCDHPSDSARRS